LISTSKFSYPPYEPLEKLHFQNVALETLFGVYKIPNWKAQRDKLAADKKIQPELRAGFHALYAELQHEPDLSVVEAFLLSLPTAGKPN